MEDLDTYFAEMREALGDPIDLGRVRTFLKRWDRHELFSMSDEAMLAFVHKTRTGHIGFPMDMRSASKRWLQERGMQSLDDGDVPPTARDQRREVTG